MAVTVDITADLNDEDETGFVWTFLDEARDPDVIVPGAIVVAGDADTPAVVEVVDIVPKSSGQIACCRWSTLRNRDRARRLASEGWLDLMRQRWDSPDTDDIEVTAAERELLDERLADLEANPEAGRSWEDVERDLRARLT